MGSGKTTLAQSLVLDHGFARLSLGGTLKAMIETLLLRTSGQGPAEVTRLMTDPALKEAPLACLSGMSPRFAMQTIGTDWGREFFGPNFWVKGAMAEAKAHLDAGRSVVFDDLRFTNEADAIVGAGGCIVQVVRPGTVRPEGCHVSEGELDDYPLIVARVVNESGKHGLARCACILLDELRS
jgi:hypothetical protein